MSGRSDVRRSARANNRTGVPGTHFQSHARTHGRTDERSGARTNGRTRDLWDQRTDVLTVGRANLFSRHCNLADPTYSDVAFARELLHEVPGSDELFTFERLQRDDEESEPEGSHAEFSD